MKANEIKKRFTENDLKKEITRLQSINSDLLSELRRVSSTKQANDKIEELNRIYKKKISDLKKAHKEDLKKANAKYKDKIIELISMLNTLVTENNIYKKELPIKHQREIDDQRRRLTSEYEKRINELEQENQALSDENKELQDEINRLKDSIEKKDYTIDKLNKQVGMNSSNSGIPTSQESFTNKARVNHYNHRTKSDKPSGGQKGHKGSTLTKEKVEKVIKDKGLDVVEFVHYVKGKKEIKVKYKLGIKTELCVERHMFVCDPGYEERLPKEFYSDVTYDNSLKTLVVMLGVPCSLSYEKICEFMNYLTDDAINMSQGTIENIYDEMGVKSQPSIDNIKTNLKNGACINTDLTTASEGGKDTYYRGYANKTNVCYLYSHHKGDKPIEEDDILINYKGVVVADAEIGIDKYGTDNQSCIVHIGRYCIQGDQNIDETDWQMEFYGFLLEIQDKRNKLIEEAKEAEVEIKSFSEEEILEISERYDEILNKAKEQNAKIKSTYWKEKEITFYNRLVKSKEQILCFTRNFKVPAHNNHMEQLLRAVKTKKKVSGGFRSTNGGERFGNMMSVIKTAKLRKLNPYHCVRGILDGKVYFA